MLLVVFVLVVFVYVECIKDLVQVGGVCINVLVGYGLVVGLDGSGDCISQVFFIVQSLKNLFGELGVNVFVNVNLQLKNVVVVVIYVELLLFVKLGQLIDIMVFLIGNVVLLCGGLLLMVLLCGVDGQVYVIVQGNLVVGGFGVQGKDGLWVFVNVFSVGCIFNGVMVEWVLLDVFNGGGDIILNLYKNDFIMVLCMVVVFNQVFGDGVVCVIDGVMVFVQLFSDFGVCIGLFVCIENFEFIFGSVLVKVVVNVWIGMVVIGLQVWVGVVVILYGLFIVIINENINVSQFNVFGNGQMVVMLQFIIIVINDGSCMFKFIGGIMFDEIVYVVNVVGVVFGDLIVILEVFKQVGVLSVEFEVI